MTNKDISPGEYILQIGGLDSWNRNYTVTVADISSGTKNAGVDLNRNECRLYALCGRPVNVNELIPGIHIKVSGNTRGKIVIK